MGGNPISDARKIFSTITGGSNKKIAPMNVANTAATGPVEAPKISDTQSMVDEELERLKRQQGRAATILRGAGDDSTLGTPKKRTLLGGGY